MRKLQIECFDQEGNLFEKITACKMDLTQIMTIIYTSVTNKENDIIRWPQSIDHWVLMEGMVTIFYTNGYFLEITRLND